MFGSVRLAALAAMALIAATAHAAQPDPWSLEAVREAFGNTIISTYPDGRTGLLWLAADGTFTGKTRRRVASSGTWKVNGSQMCLRQITPIRTPLSYCTSLPATNIWSAKAVTGETIQIRIVMGVVN